MTNFDKKKKLEFDNQNWERTLNCTITEKETRNKTRNRERERNEVEKSIEKGPLTLD